LYSNEFCSGKALEIYQWILLGVFFVVYVLVLKKGGTHGVAVSANIALNAAVVARSQSNINCMSAEKMNAFATVSICSSFAMALLSIYVFSRRQA